MRLSVASNWDKALVDRLAKINEVDSIYAKLDQDVIGGGRSAFALPQIARQKAIDYIRKTQTNKIKFNYLYNAACLGNRPEEKNSKKRIIKELSWAIDKAKVDCITVSTNFLFELVRKQFPKIDVHIGVYIRTFGIDRIKYYEDKGAKSITLPHDLNRNFYYLEKLRHRIKHIKLQLFLNSSCLFFCPFALYHPNMLAHSSQKRNKSNQSCFDYQLLNCSTIKLKCDSELIKSRWIRPEDISLYESLGFNYFKIVGRSRSTPWLIKTAEAYAQRRLKGNLSDILSFEMPGDESNMSNLVNRKFRKILGNSRMHPKILFKGPFGHGKLGYPFINNESLDGFLKYSFFKNQPCYLSDCLTCGYCQLWAKKAIRYKNTSMKRRLTSWLGECSKEFKKMTFFESEKA